MAATFSYPLTPLPGEDAWHPGVDSRVPPRLMRRCTIFLPEHALRSYDDVVALRDLCGLPVEDLAVLRAERLVLHEVLIQVTADWSVSDGPRVADLGISFRHMVDLLLERHIAPELPRLVGAVEELRSRLRNAVQAEWIDLRAGGSRSLPVATATGGGLLKWLRDGLRRVPGRHGQSARAAAGDDVPEDDVRMLQRLESRPALPPDGEAGAARAALRRVLFGLHHRHGRLWGDPEVIQSIAVELALNALAPLWLGGLLAPLLDRGAASEGYRRLPVQANPVVMNTKGASASGKSTMRPLQHGLAERLQVPWEDFALISPDIWRKRLLDYPSMGRDHKYAGACTGHEVYLIDRKLDGYMSRKAALGRMSHLLIDRFRFDSFAPDSPEAGSNLLTRFGQQVYMFFMITPPEAIVERAWKRGLEVGRFKAVEDTLGHNVEAYSGMPPLFLRWALRDDKRVHFEFLDNTVALGERPRTVAFGLNSRLVILDTQGFVDIERYRRVNVHAGAPDELYPDPGQVAIASCTGLLVQCARQFREIVLADQASGRVWLHWRPQHLVVIDEWLALGKLAREVNRLAAEAMFGKANLAAALDEAARQRDEETAAVHVRALLGDMEIHTLGTWNWAANPAPSLHEEAVQ
jgi:hypothetical protein